MSDRLGRQLVLLFLDLILDPLFEHLVIDKDLVLDATEGLKHLFEIITSHFVVLELDNIRQLSLSNISIMILIDFLDRRHDSFKFIVEADHLDECFG